MNTTTAITADAGRNASRARRAQLAQGKAALPIPGERKRSGNRISELSVSPVPAPVASAPVPAPALPTLQSHAVSGGHAVSGREMSRARRQAIVQGKNAVRQFAGLPVVATAVSTATAQPAAGGAASYTSSSSGAVSSARSAAQAMRAGRAKNGRGDAPSTRPSGRLRNATKLEYPPKVMASETYAGGKVTGVRIGRGMNVTGDERGAAVQVTGSQYIGRETGLQPREGGIKVGASRTAAGLTITGTQVRSKVQITGDESNSAIHITGEADQNIGDDLLDRRESGAYASMQYQRQHNPHGHTVFGTNLGRSSKATGSRERSRERALEFTEDGLPISGTAVGRSVNVTGDESGSCRLITGEQYLMPAARQPLCDIGTDARAEKEPVRNRRRDPVTGAKVNESETWTRQRITGVDVEHNDRVTGDEYGVCSAITGTPYVGPTSYEAVCPAGASPMTAPTASGCVTGDTPLSVAHVTGTQRGSERSITGTPYYGEAPTDKTGRDALATINARFSVRSPQREAQGRAATSAVEAPSAEARITGSFRAGNGKITGNQEFHFTPRPKGERAGRIQVTGEGRVEATAITGSAWTENARVTGTEDYIAAERNPSERAGKPHAFAGSTVFKGKGHHEEPRKIVTGMVGWSAKSAAKVTLSGGAQG